jgi:V-type H+-transporting ATPase subunit G
LSGYSAGIQTLLDAEKEAAKIVQKARDCSFEDWRPRIHQSIYGHNPCSQADTDLDVLADRNQRVKDARGEAAKEIEAYKAQQEAEFKQFEQSVSPLVVVLGNT